MKNYYIKKMVIAIFVITFSIILMPNKVQAKGLQANRGGESIVESLSDSTFVSIREIEDSQGALGTPEKEGGNGIDCHMSKATEWGTVAMLTASRYGIIEQGESNVSTTGNKSGIYQLGDNNKEWLCSTNNTSSGWRLGKLEGKYFNKYAVRENTGLKGDALTINWYGGNSRYLSDYNPFLYIGNGGYFKGREYWLW